MDDEVADGDLIGERGDEGVERRQLVQREEGDDEVVQVEQLREGGRFAEVGGGRGGRGTVILVEAVEVLQPAVTQTAVLRQVWRKRLVRGVAPAVQQRQLRSRRRNGGTWPPRGR